MTKEHGKEKIIELFNKPNWAPNELLKLALKITGEDEELSFEQLLLASSQATGVRYSDVLSKKRFRYIILSRVLCFFYLRDRGYTLAYIGSKFSKGHDTVLHHLNKLENDLEIKDEETVRAFNKFYSIINA